MLFYKEKVDTTMAVMDEFKEQREALKSKPFKEKWKYFWSYYTVHVVVTIAVLIFGTVLVHDLVTSKDYAFYAMFINCVTGNDDENFLNDFTETLDIDTKEYTTCVDTSIHMDVAGYDSNSITASQKIIAMASANEIDAVISDLDVFANYADNGMFVDLRTFLTKEQIERFSSQFFYYDVAVEPPTDYETLLATETETVNIVDRQNPDTMEDPIPVGIVLTNEDRVKLVEGGYYGNNMDLLFGVSASSARLDYCSQFLDWLTTN